VTDKDLLIDSEALHAQLGRPGLRIVDCRFDLLDPEAGQRLHTDAHIPGAVFADLDRDLSAPVTAASGRHPLPDAATMAATFGRLGITRSTRVVVYDEGGGALAARCWWLLRWLGHKNACLLNGGFARWERLGLATESGQFSVQPEDFNSEPRDHLVLRTAEIVAAGEDCRSLQLVDARDSERFAGTNEPIDPVAGHIPGAISLPLTASLKEDGTWKSAAELGAVWEQTLGEGCGRPWSTMCGSGVTACHLVVSGLLAGLPEPRVYVGSWSEWITDPERPIASDRV
jgi:thiosulfate/3-mercaptopyruvate sulfurtransferase